MSPTVYPVVVIERHATRLYGELVQKMETRNTCWLRPLALCLAAPPTAASVLDVRDGPDIICASALVKPVLDTEWLGLLAVMSHAKSACDYAQAHDYVKEFLAQLFDSDAP